MGNCFGFGYEGIRAGSVASRYQSCCYGRQTPGGGWFALEQGRGARGEGVSKCAICTALFLSIFGILLIAAGVVVGYYPEKLEPIFFYVEDVTEHEFVPMYQLMIALGVFLCMSALCACCCGGFFTVAALCYFVAFIMVFVVIGLLSHSVDSYDRATLVSKIKKDLMARINSSAVADSIWDHIQEELECCGVENPSDWQCNTIYGNGSVPNSCCKVETPKCGKNYQASDIYQDGCITSIKDKITIYFRWQIGFLAFFSLIASFVICFCFCIACCS